MASLPPERWAPSKIRQGVELILEGLRAPDDEPPLPSEAYRRLVEDLGRMRGRPLLLPYVSSGSGRGARVRLADGRSVLDFALGIGVHFFGHRDPDLVRTALEAAIEDTVMQGNLQMGRIVPQLLEGLVDGASGRLAHGWIGNSGSEANETALKIIRQKRAPATEIIAFRGCFHGRTSAMAEITDRPDYREGQPRRETVHYLPFYDAREAQHRRRTVTLLEELLATRRERIACFLFELVQGEAGFRTAPREFFEPLMKACRAAGVAVWIDEIQTFGRTGELFAFQKLDLAPYVDVVTIGKMLQAAATLYTEEYNPKPGLVSGTFAGSTVGLAVGRRIVERLRTEGYLGETGRIARLAALTAEHLARIAADLGPRRVSAIDGMGAMWALELPTRSHDAALELVRRCFEAGLLLYYGGTGPYRLRLFLPAGVLTEDELEEGTAILRHCLSRE